MSDDTDTVEPGDTVEPDEPTGEQPDDNPQYAEPTLVQRVWRRIVRRPSNWINSPWPAERVIQYLTALALVGGSTFAVLQVVHVNLVFTNTTPTGGDMGAHVMAPAYLRDHLLPHGQITGWSNYWYNGFPLYRFYMVIPALMIVTLNVIFPYSVAFKIVACLGLVTLPFCCWAFGRLCRFRFPVPELMALAGLLFLFDESFSIYGGNVKSTMAGEFSFSIALSFAVLGLGLFARGLETGKYRNWTAVVLALALLSHGIVAIFVVLAAVLMWLVWMDKTRLIYGLTMGATAILLSAFWIFPFLLNHAYMTDMKYGFRPDGSRDSFWDMFFPWPTFLDVLVTGFALIGFVSSVVKRNLNGAWLGITCFALMAATFLARDSLPVIGLLWNPRILPFLYLMRLLLAMVGVADTAHFIVKGWQMREPTVRQVAIIGVVVSALVGSIVLVGELLLYRELPGAEYKDKNGQSVYSWGIGDWDPITLTPGASDAQADGWTRYNFLGYNGRGRAAYGEYRALVNTMADLGRSADPTLGCGEALWENNSATGKYGTTMALMLLPHWTDGCIASSEGLFFEASGTTPYHFLTAAALSAHSSNPVRELRYIDNDASVGVPMAQKLGIKYVMVFTKAAKDEADTRDDLKLVATSGPWKIYRVQDSEVVVPLTVQPVVVNGRGGDQRERHLEVGTSWFQNTDEWAALPADAGPSEWQRIDVQVDTTRQVGSGPKSPGRRVDIVTPVQDIKVVDLPDITVSNYHLGDQDLSFDVSQIGVPVLVKISYFPNWQVDGAKGPYRVAPNFMVVIPTSTHVYMHYEASLTDRFFYLLTLIGIALLFFWRYRGDVVHANSHPFLLTTTDLFDEEAMDWTPAEGHVLLPELPADDEPPPADAAPSPGEDAPTEDPVDGGTDEGSFLPPGSV
jgi:hypothetical protein